ncbi:MAG: MFS transporter, partial [Chitinophagaceae bacterium]
KVIRVICSIFARFPLLVIGLLPVIFKQGTSLQVLIFLLFFHYFFGSVVGTSWNAWMKDLVPVKILGAYFSHRSRLIQILNVTLSLSIAISLDYIKIHYPQHEMMAYSVMFVVGGAIGLLGVYLLSKTPEPSSLVLSQDVFSLLQKPLRDKNFRKFLVFNSFWAFSLNIATPFIPVYLMKAVLLPISYIIGLGILSQLCSILLIKTWGKYSDLFSNKTIIGICGPIYTCCLIAWAFTGNPSGNILSALLLILISIFTGISTAGINLAMGNIGLKLAPKEDAIVYISARCMITSVFPAIAPICGGLAADFFETHQFAWNQQWNESYLVSTLHLPEWQYWKIFFFIGGLLAMLSLRMLVKVYEEGETKKAIVIAGLMKTMRFSLARTFRWQRFRRIFFKPAFLPVIKRNLVKKG